MTEKFITIEIYNALGIFTSAIKIEKSVNIYNLNLTGYPDGLYFVKLVSGNSPAILKKLVVRH